MARFRRFSRRARSRSPKASRRSSRRSGFGSVGGINLMGMATAAGYGWGRGKIQNLLAPLTNKIPAGQYADNVAAVGAAWALGKFVPSTKPITSTVMLLEAYDAGQKMAGGSTASPNVGGTVYGA